MTLVNVGPEEVTLVIIESQAFEKIEVHEMARVGGLMEMRAMTKLAVPAGGQVHVKPGGRHLMLRGPRQHLTAGQKVEMVLTLTSGIKQTISVKVAAR
jgi:copper(I)-binding protein